SYTNVLRSCFGELREAVMLVEHKYGDDGMFTSLNQEKFTNALREIPRDSALRQFAGTLFLHMGDILRYMNDEELCQKYYTIALLIQPEKGQTWNQLGVFYESNPKKTNSGSNEKLHAVNAYNLFTSLYYYYRAIFAPIPFTAEKNIKRILAKVFKEFTKNPPAKPDFEEIFLVLLAVIDSNTDITNEDALFKGFRSSIRDQILDLEVKDFLQILLIILGTYEMMIKKPKNRRIIERLLTETYEVLVGLLLQNWDSVFINTYHLYVMSMLERVSINLENHPDVKASFACVSDIMELYLERELQLDPLRNFSIDCFGPLSDLVQTDLSYASFLSYLKATIGPRKEPELPPILNTSDTTSVFDTDELNVTLTSNDAIEVMTNSSATTSTS
uniref:DNA/RNA-binding domain-containing protein n=1 Tax=Acrobeloides nanus TaxID=290746 RepID=A0A914DYY4_9BILA